MEVDASDPQVTLSFYKRLYPFKPLFTWLNQNHVWNDAFSSSNPAPSNLFTHREFAFTLIGDTYLRYHSFSNVEEFKQTALRLNPTRFEIGPIYNARPRDRKTLPPGVLKPMLRELVFDIDMTDYDEIRTCCSGKEICGRCWAYISAAVEVLDPALREEFGFKHLLWVYSGRRGIHCWVSDQAALALTDDERRTLLSYLEVIKGGKEMSKKVNVRSTTQLGKPAALHPALRESYDRLSGKFVEIVLEDQKCFDKKEGGWEELLKLIPRKDVVDALREKWEANPDKPSKAKWADFVKFMKADQTGTLLPAAEDIILQYTYPRLDAEVSKHRNHLLKAPFCIHPATGRICVPVDPAKINEFDPMTVPTVGELLEELGLAQAGGGVEGQAENNNSEWERTKLKPYVDMLEKHTAAIMADARERRQAAAKGALSW
ncbi:hypothetical protein FRC04_001917 [Tulasnella sp. 424]|nr:hypothetical protein FRC04_001917 [Tulasnella sp. 424]